VELTTPISQTEDASQYGVVDRIHFDYDKSDIKPEFVRGLENNARWMRDHKDYQMLIEGHCDERGTNEYNMALGERRAMAARNFLIQQGVQPDRLHIKSWGEEKPIAFGHDESSWWQNRRAEFLVGRGNP
jgi:peptidoglycan-associated lipoprotein